MAPVSSLSPRVSILLPTYNRARFLPAAFDSIGAQTLEDWELVIVDDGSTDETVRLIEDLKCRIPQAVHYERQENAGPYAARNRALDLGGAPYVAFFDSDDLWLPHHLEHCTDALNRNPEVDWVYAACRVVNYQSGEVVDPDTFRMGGEPRPFLELGHRRIGALHLIDDERAVRYALGEGLWCGLQNSVIRRSVFEESRFQTAFRNEAEDQLFVIRALKHGHCFGYLDTVQVEYRVHDANSSASATGQTLERQLAVYRPVVRGFEQLRTEFDWSGPERRALERRIAREHFWHIGYSLLWENGRRAEGLESFRIGLRAWPWSLACWKTYLFARLRQVVG